MYSNNNSSQGGNIFTRNQSQQQSQGNVFANQSQGQQNNLFNANRTQTGMFNNTGSSQSQNNVFANNQSQGGGNNLLSGNQQQGSTNLFNRSNNGTGNNLFNQGSNTGNTGNMFNQGGTTLFSPGTSNQTSGLFNNTYNQYGSNNNSTGFKVNPNCPVNEAKVYELMNTPLDKQRIFFETFQPDYLKQLISYYRKSIQPLKTQKFQLGTDNPFKNQRITKIATNLNIKPQLIQMKKMIRDNLTTKIKKLKEDKQKLDHLSLNFSKEVFQKLQKYKQKLIISVTQNKMIEEVKKEVDQIEQEIKQFFKPLFNAQQNKASFSFIDPNPFCISISQKLLKNMTMLENRMDQILACDGDEENVDTADVVMQLVDYYQNVAVALKDYTVKYNQLKRKVLQRSRQSNPDEAFKKLSQRASSIVKKEMEAYQIVKQIESTLQRRQTRSNDRKY